MDDRLEFVGVADIVREGVLRARSGHSVPTTDGEEWAPEKDQRRPAVVATAIAAVLAGGYLLAPLTGQDLSAQLARADFAYAHPFTPVDLRWFGGSLQFGYSLWAPWLAGLIGTRLLGALMAVLGTWLATRLMQLAAPARPLWGGIAMAVCQVANLA
ncbi:MAG TPA: hypothetical protein VEK09_03565, partial [Jatrophihabitantaceae bacterium]|nr:hypothetical protein [Jatrophihabitantaceae bacterium]